MNAFVLPGGKVCVFTGILNVTQDEYGLATVLGHEVGHVVARTCSRVHHRTRTRTRTTARAHMCAVSDRQPGHAAEKWSKMRWERALGWLTAILIAREEPGWLINQVRT